MPNIRLPRALSRAMRTHAAKAVAAEMASRPTPAAAHDVQKSDQQHDKGALVRHGLGMRLKSFWMADPSCGGRLANEVQKSWVQKNAGAYQSVFGQGGSLVREEYSSEIIELLRPRTVLLRMGARAVSFNGKMNIGRLNGGAVAHMVDEGTAPPRSSVRTGAVVLEGHKGMVLLDASNDLLRNPNVESAGLLSDDMIQALALKSEEQGLFGDGKGPNCTGLLKQVAASQKVNGVAVTSANVANVTMFVGELIQRVKASNIPFEGNSPGWIMSSKLEQKLKYLRDSAGWVFKDELDNGRLGGHPTFITETVPENFISFGLASQLFYGLDGEMLLASAEPEYERDVTTFRALQKFDWKLRHNVAWSYSNNLTFA